MANRVNLGGAYPSQGADSFGELRYRHYIEYPNATVRLIQQIMMNNEGYDSPREVLADMILGNLDEQLKRENEVDPESYDREAWVESQESEAEGDD